MIRVTPITLPEGWSIDNPHLENSYLHEDGRLEIIPKLDPARVQSTEMWKNDPKRFDRHTIRERLLDTWNLAGFAPMTGNN